MSGLRATWAAAGRGAGQVNGRLVGSLAEDGGVLAATSLERGVPESFTSATTGVLTVPSRGRTGVEFYV